MLYCNINPQAINPLCGQCRKCSGRSRCDYPFEKDLLNSDDLVAAIIDFVKANTGYACERTQVHKKPDINVFAPNGEIICRIEAKYLEGQAFMKSQQYIGLHPRETLVVDEPKLLSYFECKQNDRAQGKKFLFSLFGSSTDTVTILVELLCFKKSIPYGIYTMNAAREDIFNVEPQLTTSKMVVN